MRQENPLLMSKFHFFFRIRNVFALKMTYKRSINLGVKERNISFFNLHLIESFFFSWHVDKLEFKPSNQPQRFLFYDRSARKSLN